MAESKQPDCPVPVHGANGVIGWTSEPMYSEGLPLVTCRGSNSGMVLWADGPLWVSNNAMAITPKNGNNRFLFYSLLLSPPYSVVTGSAQPQITRRDLVGHKIAWANPTLQDAIASVLGALDDKIELNRRINETLEEMTRAIFKDWFVDFGPTRAKMECRAPYLSPDIWSLFPERFDEDGKPEGWEAGRLDALGEVAIGGLWGNDEPQSIEEIGFACLRGVDLQHLREQGSANKTPRRYAKLQAVQRRGIGKNDVLVASSGAGPCGRSLWVGLDGFFQTHLTTYSNFVKRISCKSDAAACFVDRLLFEMRESGEINKYITGTSVPNLNDRGLMESHKVILPPGLLMEHFRDVSLMVQEHLFSGENETIARTRDLLLPKLMLGEIRVKDAEKLVGDAT